MPKPLHPPGLLSALCLVLILAGCAAPVTPEPQTPVSLKLSWSPGIQFIGFYVAQAKGYYAEENLDVSLLHIEEAAEMNQTPGKVARRELDFGLGGQSLILIHQDMPLVMIASLYQFTPAALFFRRELGIQTPADLKGRSVAIKSKAWEALIDALLDSFGLAPTDITKVPAGFDMTPFYDGEVDVWAGWITNEVIIARDHGLDIATLPLYEYGIRNNDNMLYTSQELAASDPEMVVGFLRASLRGWDWAVQHPAEAVDLFIARYPEQAARRDFHLAAFEASIPLIEPRGVQAGNLDCSAPQFRDVILKPELCDSSFLQKARESR